jgi:hypothetical protein
MVLDAVRVANQLTCQAREPKKEIDAFKLNTKGQAPRQRREAFAMPSYGTSLTAAHANSVSAHRPEESSLGALGTNHRFGKRSKDIGSVRSQIVEIVRKKGER